MTVHRQPFLIIPKLILQPTWGGIRIATQKSWTNLKTIKDKRIGQSYELFGASKILTSINDSGDPRFLPEIGWAEKSDSLWEGSLLQERKDYFTLADIIRSYPIEFLGKNNYEKFGKMPLLIKMTESRGNSYQLHVRPSAKQKTWQPKAESWHYFEDGLITFGIKPGIKIDDYKKTCLEIDTQINKLSKLVVGKKLSLAEAEKKAVALIDTLNPRQYVNFHKVKKYDLVDLSPGGIHHSWEEDDQLCPGGNYLYEVQQDVMDPVSTIRCFDQGKFKKDGTVRKINIEDYFLYLDNNQNHNDLESMRRKRMGTNLLTTPYYSLDILKIKGRLEGKTNGSFVHLFVKEGKVEVAADEGSVMLSAGHSCFIPEFTKSYEIKNKSTVSVILKTYIS